MYKIDIFKKLRSSGLRPTKQRVEIAKFLLRPLACRVRLPPQPYISQGIQSRLIAAHNLLPLRRTTVVSQTHLQLVVVSGPLLTELPNGRWLTYKIIITMDRKPNMHLRLAWATE